MFRGTLSRGSSSPESVPPAIMAVDAEKFALMEELGVKMVLTLDGQKKEHDDIRQFQRFIKGDREESKERADYQSGKIAFPFVLHRGRGQGA